MADCLMQSTWSENRAGHKSLERSCRWVRVLLSIIVFIPPSTFQKADKDREVAGGKSDEEQWNEASSASGPVLVTAIPSQMPGIVAAGHVQLLFSRWSAQPPPDTSYTSPAESSVTPSSLRGGCSPKPAETVPRSVFVRGSRDLLEVTSLKVLGDPTHCGSDGGEATDDEWRLAFN
ncbi:hypothetical protein EYF80_009716 [Liparis tanakae]|uniref:Uncharacterized protein n=1 Tax=Liparis tanakae TaxID=230148 RepID=A0A4Z2IRA3_9TELE|nr:hypothetical protein EYF80_009716 [Liparis tanakae]